MLPVETEQKRYTPFLKLIVSGYIATGFRPNSGVFFDPDRMECEPLVVIALYKAGLEGFKNKWGHWNEMGMYHWITHHFQNNFGWVEGFRRGFNMQDSRKHGWDETSFSGGYRVGREVRRRLKEIYYKRHGPASLDAVDW